MRKVFIIQKPRPGHSFDMGAVERLGEIHYLLPAPPNVHDQARLDADISHVRKTIRESHPGDCFVVMGGSPISIWVWGVAHALEGREIQMGMFSRGRDRDGRRTGEGGNYRLVPLSVRA